MAGFVALASCSRTESDRGLSEGEIRVHVDIFSLAGESSRPHVTAACRRAPAARLMLVVRAGQLDIAL